MTTPDEDESWSPALEFAVASQAFVEAKAEANRLVEDAKKRLREAAGQLVREQDIADVYWRYPQVAVKDIGDVAEVQAIARRYAPVGGKCVDCGEDVVKTSRSDTSRIWVHPACREARNKAWQTQDRARQVRIQELRTMPYKEYLKTPEWQETRRAKLKSAKYRCQVCDQGNCQLDVHHRTYERRGNENWQDLIVLCHGCHGTFHGKK